MRELALIGAGRVGRAFLTFWNDREIIIVDPHVDPIDFLGQAVVDEIKPGMAQTAVVAVPGDIAPRKIIQCLEAGMNVLDISFHNAENEIFNKIALENACWYVPDAGFGPGIMNAMAARCARRLSNNVHSINMYIGGVPELRIGPWYYKSTWNTEDHLSEYTRPARYIENTQIKTVMPLESDIRTLNTAKGTMEAFCSDGLRTLLRHQLAPNMAEFTLRWPGFIQNMQLMYQSGMLRPETIQSFADGIWLSKQWLPEENEIDLSVLQVEAKKGSENANMRMIHRRDGLHSSMSWCTAVGASAALHIATYHKLSSGIHYIEDLVFEDNVWRDYLAMLVQGGLEIFDY